MKCLSASVFGGLWRLEPLPQERKAKWKREMGWLLAVSDHIVEFVASSQSLPNGNITEVCVLLISSVISLGGILIFCLPW